MAPYCTVGMIRNYCKLLESTEVSDADLLTYAEGEDNLTLNAILVKQYDLTDVQAAVTADNAMGKAVKVLSAKLGALAALKAVYSSGKRNHLKPKIDELENDVSNTLRQLKVGEIRL